MRKMRFLAVFGMVLLALLISSCVVNVPDSAYYGGTVIVKNNSNKSFRGTVRTDSRELFNGTIRAWNSKTFRIDEGTVYTDFESDNGGVSNPSGYVSKGRVLILDL